MSISPRVSELEESSEAPTHATGDEVTAPLGGRVDCVDCGYSIAMLPSETIPECPGCGGHSFRRARMFEPVSKDVDSVQVAVSEPRVVAAARAELAPGIPHLAWEGDDGEVVMFPLHPGWIRIGRSGAADIRLDDPTVSRRHALVVLTDEGEVRVLDDRSLNGLFVNGERVEWAALDDGDELEIGRYCIYLIKG